MKKLLCAASVACIVALFSGCAAKGTKFTEFENPKSGNAVLYVYRPTKLMGGMISYDVNVQTAEKNKVIGSLKMGGYLQTEIPAESKVTVWAETEARDEIVLNNLKPNWVYCVKSEMGWGGFVGRPHFAPVALETCKKEIAETNLSI